MKLLDIGLVSQSLTLNNRSLRPLSLRVASLLTCM
jgi:hypothetical protein